MAAGSTKVQAHLLPAAGRSVVRSASSGSCERLASGLPAAALRGSTAVAVPAVSQCMARKRDAVPGYRGFVPGKKAETVVGGTFANVNADAHELRPLPTSGALQDYTVFLPPEPKGKRTEDEIARTAYLQQYTPWINDGQQPREHGAALPGYCGHHSMRRSPSSPTTALEHGERHLLDTRLPTDRDCQPFDVHRSKVPGYTGHVRFRAIS